MLKNKDVESLVTELCERFTKAFKEIKQLKESRIAIENENLQIKLMIEDEINSHQESITLIQNQIMSIQEKFDELGSESEFKKNEEYLINLESEIKNQKRFVEIYQAKDKELRDIIEQQRDRAEENQNEINSLEGECDKLRKNLSRLENEEDKRRQVISNLKSLLEEGEEKLKRQAAKLDEKELMLRSILEAKIEKEDMTKNLEKEYRELLKNTSNNGSKISEEEKNCNKLSETLGSKMKRLEVLIKQNQKMGARIIKLEEQGALYQKIIAENRALREENEKTRREIEVLTNRSFDAKFDVGLKKILKERLNKSYILNNNSRKTQVEVFGSQQGSKRLDPTSSAMTPSKLVSSNASDVQLKQNIIQKEIIKSKKGSLQEVDNTIYLNQRRLKEMEQKIQKLGEGTAALQYENQNLERECLTMEDKIQTLSRRYNNLLEEPQNLKRSPKKSDESLGTYSHGSSSSKEAEHYYRNQFSNDSDKKINGFRQQNGGKNREDLTNSNAFVDSNFNTFNLTPSSKM